MNDNVDANAMASLMRLNNAAVVDHLVHITEQMSIVDTAPVPPDSVETLISFLMEGGLQNLEFSEVKDAVVSAHQFCRIRSLHFYYFFSVSFNFNHLFNYFQTMVLGKRPLMQSPRLLVTHALVRLHVMS